MTDEYIHICVDAQGKYIRNLAPVRQKLFPSLIASFSSALKQRLIDTVWVAYGVPGQRPEFAEEKAAALGICGQRKAGDAVFVKGQEDAFDGAAGRASLLADYLLRIGKRRIIVTGMETTTCVPQSVVGALLRDAGGLYGFEIVVITDLLAQSGNANAVLDADPSWHARAARAKIESRTIGIKSLFASAVQGEDATAKVRYMTSAELLAELDKKPAPAARQTPVLSSKRQAFG